MPTERDPGDPGHGGLPAVEYTPDLEGLVGHRGLRWLLLQVHQQADPCEHKDEDADPQRPSLPGRALGLCPPLGRQRLGRTDHRLDGAAQGIGLVSPDAQAFAAL